MKSTTDYTDIVVFGTRGHTLDVIRGMEDYWQGHVHMRAMIDEAENGFMHPLLSVPVFSMEDRSRDWADLPVLSPLPIRRSGSAFVGNWRPKVRFW